MKELEIMLFVAIMVMSVLLIVLLRKITLLKRQTDDIIQEIKFYLACIMDEQEETDGKKEIKAVGKEEQQSRIIQAVLGEYFPQKMKKIDKERVL